MRLLTPVLLLLAAAPVTVAAQAAFPVSAAEDDEADPEPFYCPMDPDVRSKLEGKCSKCGMALVLGIPNPAEYAVKLTTEPRGVVPGKPVEPAFEILEPGHDHRVTEFNVVHEKIFHLLFVSHDLEVFAHEHPELDGDGVFRLNTVFPKAGIYRLLTDFYPQGSTPQMIPVTVTTRGFERSLQHLKPQLETDLAPKSGGNLIISLRPEPAEPIAALKTMLFFTLDTADGLEKFLGAWAHMLAASDDMVDLIHAHPAIADGGPQIQMNVIFPRPGMYRIWIQVQRKGVVNTVSFTVPVRGL